MTNAAMVNPSWSPDGKQIVFTSVMQPTELRSSQRPGQQDIWTISIDGSKRRKLTDGTATNLAPCWAVNNRVYFISDRSGANAVWSVRADAPSAATADRKDLAEPKTDVTSAMSVEPGDGMTR